MVADQEVIWVRRCELRVQDASWPFAERHAAASASHWQRGLAENPRMFNGCILILVAHELRDDVFYGRYARTDFASYLYWRETGFDDAPTCDAFAMVMLGGRDGGWLLAQAAGHTLNAGLYVPPGGLIDERDADPAGLVDIRRSALREMAEETGLSTGDVVLAEGTWIARDNALLALALPCTSRMANDAVIERVNRHNRAACDAELDNALWLMPGELDAAAGSAQPQVPKYLRLLLAAQAGQTAQR